MSPNGVVVGAKKSSRAYQATTPKLEPPLKTCCTFNVVLINYFIDIFVNTHTTRVHFLDSTIRETDTQRYA